MAVITDIADAVVAELNDHEFSQEFTAERTYDTTLKLEDAGTLHVTVVPKALAEEVASRAADQVDYVIDVGVRKKPTSVSNAELDPLVALVEEIRAFFRRRRLTAYPGAICIRTPIEPIFAPEHLREYGQFTSILSLTFRVVR
ncbi:MAG: hypothetical protein FJ288_16355 [Planctomycetes bacterium]|nr:hypothetical protein [Planctomycetota bacterium]